MAYATRGSRRRKPARKKKPGYLSRPAVGHAEDWLRRGGIEVYEYVGTTDIALGPVHIFETSEGTVSVGRVRGDDLDARRFNLALPNKAKKRRKKRKAPKSRDVVKQDVIEKRVAIRFGPTERKGRHAPRKKERQAAKQRIRRGAWDNSSAASEPDMLILDENKLYDPRVESIRAITQGMYETQVRRKAGKKYTSKKGGEYVIPFRDARGKRLDVRMSYYPDVFGLRTGVSQKQGRLFKGTQDVTVKAIRESRRRYNALDPQTENFVGWNHLVENRQDYEETLAIPRKSGFYRVTPERTRTGIGYFVWPLRPGQAVPQGATTYAKAKGVADKLNRTADPRKTGRWRKPTGKVLTERNLAHWLPKDSDFQQLKLLPKPEPSPPPLAVEVGRKGGKVQVKKGKIRGRDAWKVFVAGTWTGAFAYSPEKAERMARRAG